MSFAHGKDTDIYLGGYDLTAYFNDVSVNREADLAETSTFGNTAKTFLAGLKDAVASLAGFFDGAANAVDERLNAMFAQSTVCSFFWAGDTIGNRAMLMSGIENSYEIGASVGDAVGVSAEIQASGGADSGVSLAEKSARATTGGTNLTSVDFGAASTSSSGFVTNLHVFGVTGAPTLTAKIQDSADNVTFADVTGGAFTAATGVTSQQLTSSSVSVRRYVRVTYIVAGASTTVTFAVSFAKR
jgi:hypothetical protein